MKQFSCGVHRANGARLLKVAILTPHRPIIVQGYGQSGNVIQISLCDDLSGLFPGVGMWRNGYNSQRDGLPNRPQQRGIQFFTGGQDRDIFLDSNALASMTIFSMGFKIGQNLLLCHTHLGHVFLKLLGELCVQKSLHVLHRQQGFIPRKKDAPFSMWSPP